MEPRLIFVDGGEFVMGHDNRSVSPSTFVVDGEGPARRVSISSFWMLMSDTCNAARATKRLLAEMAEKAGRERIGTKAWEGMSEEEREKACKCHLGDCHDHMRNILIKAMAEAATDYLKGELDDSLDAFSSYDRMSVDPMDAIRAACKELHPEGEYAKGKGRESEATRKRDHPSDLWLPIFNGVGNSRMDAVFDGAVPLYMNRLNPPAKLFRSWFHFSAF
jgi:hypothetical protein